MNFFTKDHHKNLMSLRNEFNSHKEIDITLILKL